MVYVGSKNRISKEIVPIIQSYIKQDTVAYIEPFVGGANVIDKIEFENKIGYDNNKYLIAVLQQAQLDSSVFPITVSEEEHNRIKRLYYNYINTISTDDMESNWIIEEFNNTSNWYIGLIGFCTTFGSEFMQGFARAKGRDISKERINNLKKQSVNLSDIKFECQDFLQLLPSSITNSVIYCDPPYKDARQYKTGKFNHELYYNWCRELKKNGNTVICSEHNMPDDFKCIWEKEIPVNANNNDITENRKRTEKLFIL